MFQLIAKPAKSHQGENRSLLNLNISYLCRIFSQIGIDQGENQLTELSAAMLRPLPLLEQLLLGGKFKDGRTIVDGNRITELGAIFGHNKQLQVIDFSQNRLQKIDPATFPGLKKLRWLSIGSNKLTTIPAGTFQGLEQLQKLDLRGNPWNSLSFCINSTSLPLLNDLRGVSFC